MLKWLIALAVVLSLSAGIYAAYTSPEFVNCKQHEGQYPTADNKEDKAASVLVPAPTDGRVLWACIGGYSNANGAAITAIATLLLFVVTGLLAYVAIDQGATTKRQTRAYVALDHPVFAEKYPKEMTIRVRNEGQTPAYKAWGHLNWEKVDFGGELPADFTFPDREFPGERQIRPLITINPHCDFTFTFEAPLEQMIGILDRKNGLFIYGHVDYVDAFGGRRTSQFCYRYLGARLTGDGGDHLMHRLSMDEQHNDAT